MGEITVSLPDSIQQLNGLLDTHHDNWYFTWLEWLCGQLPQVRVALVVADESHNGQFYSVAVWPEEGTQDKLLLDAADETLKKKQPLIMPLDDGKHHIGSYPVFVDGAVRTVVTVLLNATDEEALHKSLATIEYAAGWLELRLSRNLLSTVAEDNQRQHIVIDSIAHVLGERDFEHAALRFVNLMGQYLHAERVVLGFVKNAELEVHSESNSSGHSKKHELVKLTAQAMQEAVDQQESIVWPIQDNLNCVTHAHSLLADEKGHRALMTIPLVDKEDCYGAVLFDRPVDQPFSQEEQLTAQALTNFVGVVLEEKRQSCLPLYAYVYRSFKNQLSLLFGPGHLGRKITLLSLVVLSLFFSLMPGRYNIGADAVIEGAEIRSIVVPYDGYLQRATFRAGDTLKKGALLAELDTRELRLQLMSWVNQEATSRRKYEEALARNERTQVQINSAQGKRAQAEIELLEYQISQAVMKAPFDALIVSGDLSQRIGTLVRQGDVLFELSPRRDFRLAMYVDEFRINDIRQAQTGQLVLAALPDQKFSFTVTRINPMAEVIEGATVYRVEADFENKADMLRVGLEGVAQIYVDERLLISIWTRSMVDWMKLQWWRFWG
ncbi:HlyD family efflux transporter periplasmic adaptor subunit [Amphritea sp. 1_MG-2023]|uniref:HlyD family efflux transporter periplasmic adaptor subunit n=1 Tax=Amphritea sp. 1_MG-2023 TaxID=3062670 RepID=UPI0026E17694|nr:HlyD family efflux transporter periplasmic adaptor subunit [Amphritea sp. 1_MG-2023]MDO6563432.1 HlyD family efflux transporter periplasmic adaptor subunit [Amphritea sp. 1_MG-2023]